MSLFFYNLVTDNPLIWSHKRANFYECPAFSLTCREWVLWTEATPHFLSAPLTPPHLFSCPCPPWDFEALKVMCRTLTPFFCYWGIPSLTPKSPWNYPHFFPSLTCLSLFQRRARSRVTSLRESCIPLPMNPFFFHGMRIPETGGVGV